MSRQQKKRLSLILLTVLTCLTAIIMLFGYNHFNNKQKNVLVSSEKKTSKKEESDPVSDGDIYIYSLNGQIEVFVKGSKKESDRYIGYRIQNTKRELNREVNASNYDVWNLHGAYEYRNHSEDNFINLAKIVREGEWELALKEKGANDFVGGSLHGDEITTEYALFIDGKEANVDEFIKKHAKEIKFVTKSDLYRDNTITKDLEKIAEHIVNYTFNAKGLIIDQEVKFLEQLTLEKSYLSMLPILRKSNEDNGTQITDTLVIGEDKYDVSEAEFKISGVNNQETSKVRIIGKESGITADIEVKEKEPSLPTTFLISNSKYYNKAYFVFNPKEYVVEKGEVWKQSTHYLIDTIN